MTFNTHVRFLLWCFPDIFCTKCSVLTSFQTSVVSTFTSINLYQRDSLRSEENQNLDNFYIDVCIRQDRNRDTDGIFHTEKVDSHSCHIRDSNCLLLEWQLETIHIGEVGGWKSLK